MLIRFWLGARMGSGTPKEDNGIEMDDPAHEKVPTIVIGLRLPEEIQTSSKDECLGRGVSATPILAGSCPILCPAVPKIVPLLYTAADHVMAFGGIYESARSPSLPRIIDIKK